MLSLLILGIVAFAAIPQQDDDDKDKKNAPKVQPKAQPKALTVEDESIPDSLVHSRWKIQKTAPVLTADLDSSALDLRMPENVKQQVEYNDSLNLYVIGSKMGDSYLNAPIVMTPEEYMRWSERKARQQFFRVKERFRPSCGLQVICHLQQLLRGQAALFRRQVHDAFDVVEPA